MFDGFIKTVGYDPIAGHYITLQAGNYTLSYCHLSEIWVKNQEMVYAGDALGKQVHPEGLPALICILHAASWGK